MTIIPYFKVTEKYDLATPCKVMRRDLRSGQASATAKMLENKQGVALDVHFGQPFPGDSVSHSSSASLLIHCLDEFLPLHWLFSSFVFSSFSRLLTPGRLEEVYSSPEPGVMHVTSTIFLGKESLGTTQVSAILEQPSGLDRSQRPLPFLPCCRFTTCKLPG